jgi:hypothetical protein
MKDMKIIVKKDGENDRVEETQLVGKDLFQYLHNVLGSPADHVIKNMIQHKQDMSWLNDQCWVYNLSEALEHWRQVIESVEHSLDERSSEMADMRYKIDNVLKDIKGESENA